MDLKTELDRTGVASISTIRDQSGIDTPRGSYNV